MRYTVLFALVFMGMQSAITQENNNPRLIYFGDPMCSWCYGFTEELTRLREAYEGQLAIEIKMGGLRPGGGDAWTADFREFLRHHWQDVSRASGTAFNYDLLDWPSFEYDTEPACRAMLVLREQSPDRVFEIFRDVQHAFYVENKDIKKGVAYKEICSKYGLNYTVFERRFYDEKTRDLINQEFIFCRQMGVNSFPSVLLVTENEVYSVASGYTKFALMKKRIDDILSQR